jgi:glycosyltransferase involved in cell wall biosynthesis
VPGKFISYISNGLPVFCILNKGNPLIEIINNNMLGVALASDDIAAIRNNLVNFIKLIQKYNLSKNCLEYAHKHYDISSIAKQIRESF